MNIDDLYRYFPELTPRQKEQFAALDGLYREWNEQINVISRKDIDSLYEKHVLHSLGIARFFALQPGQKVLDIGTGGGFPGIPLAIFFPETEFLLVDSIGKKIKVVSEVAAALDLRNAEALHTRAEDLKEDFDLVVSRAVAPVLKLANWGEKKLRRDAMEPSGFLLLKGGDLNEEISEFKKYYKWYKVKEYELRRAFREEFFESKKLLHVHRN